MFTHFRYAFLVILMFSPLFLHAAIVAPDGFPEPLDAYTLFQYKSNPIRVTPAEPVNVNFKSYVNINWHPLDPAQQYTLVYKGFDRGDTVTATAVIPANWNGKAKIPFNVKAESPDVGTPRRKIELKLQSQNPLLSPREEGKLYAEIIPPVVNGQYVWFPELSYTLAEPSAGLTTEFSTLVRVNYPFAKRTYVNVKTNGYPGLTCDSVRFEPNTPAALLTFKLKGNAYFINDNIRISLVSAGGYEVKPGYGTLEAEVKPQHNVNAKFISTPNKTPLSPGQSVKTYLQTAGFNVISETKIRVTLSCSGSAKIGSDILLYSPSQITPEKPKKNEIVLEISGTDTAMVEIIALNDYKSAGKSKTFALNIKEVIASSKKRFAGEVRSPASYKIKIENPQTPTAVCTAFLSDTILTVIPPARQTLANPPTQGYPAGIIDDITPSSFSYEYGYIPPKYPLGFLDQFEYRVNGTSDVEEGLVRVYGGSSVTKGSHLWAGSDSGLFLKTPNLFAYAYDPVKDPYEAKKPKKFAMKAIEKADKNGTDTRLAFSVSRSPLLYDKAALSKAYKQGTFFSDLNDSVQKNGGGAELFLNWNQGKAGDPEYVPNLKNTPFGAVIFVPPALSDSPIRLVSDSSIVTDSVLKDGIEIYVRGSFFTQQPKAYIEYLQSGKVKKAMLKVVKTPKKSNSEEYTFMDGETNISQARIVMPNAKIIEKIKAESSRFELVIDSGSGLVSRRIYQP